MCGHTGRAFSQDALRAQAESFDRALRDAHNCGQLLSHKNSGAFESQWMECQRWHAVRDRVPHSHAPHARSQRGACVYASRRPLWPPPTRMDCAIPGEAQRTSRRSRCSNSTATAPTTATRWYCAARNAR